MTIEEFLKIIPGIAMFPFSFYFAWKKLGTSITVSYSIRHEYTLPSRISEILLKNRKDKVEIIHSIQAVIQKDHIYEVERFSPPLVLKANETLLVEPKPYSKLSVSSGIFQPILSNKDIEIYLITSTGAKLCKNETHPDLLTIQEFKDLIRVTKETKQFNGAIYGDSAKYAITYRCDGEIKTALIDDSGLITGAWKYRINKITPEAMRNKESIITYLNDAQFDKATEWFTVDRLDN